MREREYSFSSSSSSENLSYSTAKQLFDSEDIIPSSYSSQIIQWLKDSFSTTELQALYVAIEANHKEENSNKHEASVNYSERIQQRLYLLTQACQTISVYRNPNDTQPNETTTTDTYPIIPNEKHKNNQMEQDIDNNTSINYKNHDNNTSKSKNNKNCLQQQVVMEIQKMRTWITILQQTQQYQSTTSDYVESKMLQPLMDDCKRNIIQSLRQIRSILHQQMVPILAINLKIQQVQIAIDACLECHLRRQKKKYSLKKIPRMYPNQLQSKHFHLQNTVKGVIRHDDARELIRHIAAIKIQTYWRGCLVRFHILQSIPLDELSLYISILLDKESQKRQGKEAKKADVIYHSFFSNTSENQRLQLLVQLREKVTLQLGRTQTLHVALVKLIQELKDEMLVQSEKQHSVPWILSQ